MAIHNTTQLRFHLLYISLDLAVPVPVLSIDLPVDLVLIYMYLGIRWSAIMIRRFDEFSFFPSAAL